jgi:hypothetical protein
MNMQMLTTMGKTKPEEESIRGLFELGDVKLLTV